MYTNASHTGMANEWNWTDTQTGTPPGMCVLRCLVSVQCHEKCFFFSYFSPYSSRYWVLHSPYSNAKLIAEQIKNIDGKATNSNGNWLPQLMCFILLFAPPFCAFGVCWPISCGKNGFCFVRCLLLMLWCGWSVARTVAGLSRCQRPNSPRKCHHHRLRKIFHSNIVGSFSIFLFYFCNKIDTENAVIERHL